MTTSGPSEDFDGPHRVRRESAWRDGFKLGVMVGFLLLAVPVVIVVAL